MAATMCPSWFVLAIAVGVLSTLSASTPQGTTNQCERLHIITANNHTNGTAIMYKTSQSSDLLTTIFPDHFLPPPSICGKGYERCAIHITSNYDRTIRVAIFPLNSGIGLVSYDVDAKGTLFYREHFILAQVPSTCTYVYFIETREVFGYCLDLSGDWPYLRSLRINIQHDNLSMSSVKEHNRAESIKLINLSSLSNFVFFDSTEEPADGCFSNEDGHVVCLENGEVIDHSFSNEYFTSLDPRIRNCTNVSRLLQVGTTCKLAAHCGNEVYVFQVHQDQPTLLSDGNSEQVFVCPDLRYAKFSNGELSLHTENGTQTGNIVPFPLKLITRGDCLIIGRHVLFLSTLANGRTLLTNFTEFSYRELGGSEHVEAVPSKVINGRIGLIQSGNDTSVYDLSLPSSRELIVIPGNFVLGNYILTGRPDWHPCPTVPKPSIDQSTGPPASTTDKKSLVIVVSVVVVVIVIVALTSLVVAIMILFLYVKRKCKDGRTSSGENGKCKDGRTSSGENGFPNPLHVDTSSNADEKSTASEPGVPQDSLFDLNSPSETQVLLGSRRKRLVELTPEIGTPSSTPPQSNNSITLHVGQPTADAIQCSSPRNSYHESSAYQGGLQVSPRHANRFSGDFGGIPVQATQDSPPGYLSGPQHYLESSPNPLPDPVQRTWQRRAARENEAGFNDLVNSTLMDGGPNND